MRRSGVCGRDRPSGRLRGLTTQSLDCVYGAPQGGPAVSSAASSAADHEGMAQWMDKPTEGALGGSAFHTLRITVDWIHSRAAFER